MWADIQVLTAGPQPKTAAVNLRGEVHQFGQDFSPLDAEEAFLFTALIERQRIRISCQGSAMGMARTLRVYDPSYLMSYLEFIECAGFSPQVHASLFNPLGELRLIGYQRHTKETLYGGITTDRSTFVVVPDAMINMFYQQTVIQLLVERGHAWEKERDIHLLAQAIQNEEFASDPPSPIVALARHCNLLADSWRTIAGNHPVPVEQDPQDIRHLV